jgi:hypothetical protein
MEIQAEQAFEFLIEHVARIPSNIQRHSLAHPLPQQEDAAVRMARKRFEPRVYRPRVPTAVRKTL